MDKKRLFKILAYLIFFIFVINFIAVKLYWYSAISWFDMSMHFLGGFWVSLVFIYFFWKENSQSPYFKISTILLSVLFIGVGWEVFEIMVNEAIAESPFDYFDTLSDIFFDLAGGLCAILYIWKKQEKKQ